MLWRREHRLKQMERHNEVQRGAGNKWKNWGGNGEQGSVEKETAAQRERKTSIMFCCTLQLLVLSISLFGRQSCKPEKTLSRNENIWREAPVYCLCACVVCILCV